MKAVMISIQPWWCELIAQGMKTIEIRKTRPKLELPFKCYIYCTVPKTSGDIFHVGGNAPLIGNGMVVGEFICDEIHNYRAEFHEGNKKYYEAVVEVLTGEDGEQYTRNETTNEDEDPDDCFLLRSAAMTFDQLKAYEGCYGYGKLYGWQISDLVIYDKPQELSEFYKECEHYDDCHNNKCPLYDEPIGEYNEVWMDCEGKKPITRPPQNWCYVEEHIPEKRHFDTVDIDNIFE